jgi:hypothetical protein
MCKAYFLTFLCGVLEHALGFRFKHQFLLANL